MLSHIERKILRIIINCSHYGRNTLPSLTVFMRSLCQWTNHDESYIYDVLESLQAKGYFIIDNNHIRNISEKPRIRNW